MKKIFFACVVILAINQYGFGQEADRKVTIQTSPFLFLSDIFSDEGDMLFAMDLEGQFKLSGYSNVSITLSFLINNRTDVGYDDYSYKENIFQIGLKPMYIHRPFGTGLRGFFLGVYPNIGFQHVQKEDDSQLYTELGFGLNLGYKWVFRSGFTMQVGGGIGKTYSIPPKLQQYIRFNSDGRITFVHTDLCIDFKLGYSF